MHKLRTLALALGISAGLLMVPASAQASTPSGDSVSAQQSSQLGVVRYWSCRKGYYSFGGWYSDFVIINARFNGWDCWL